MGSTRKQKDEEVNSMNKNIKKLAVMTLAGLTLCGTAVAAPHGGRGGAPRPAPTHHRTPAPMVHGGGQNAPQKLRFGGQVAEGDREAMRKHPRGNHAGGWIALGAAAIGGLVGGIIGACR